MMYQEKKINKEVEYGTVVFLDTGFYRSFLEQFTLDSNIVQIIHVSHPTRDIILLHTALYHME